MTTYPAPKPEMRHYAEAARAIAAANAGPAMPSGRYSSTHSERMCIEDGDAQAAAGNHGSALMWYLRSIEYSQGVFSPACVQVAQLLVDSGHTLADETAARYGLPKAS